MITLNPGYVNTDFHKTEEGRNDVSNLLSNLSLLLIQGGPSQSKDVRSKDEIIRGQTYDR